MSCPFGLWLPWFAGSLFDPLFPVFPVPLTLEPLPEAGADDPVSGLPDGAAVPGVGEAVPGVGAAVPGIGAEVPFDPGCVDGIDGLLPGLLAAPCWASAKPVNTPPNITTKIAIFSFIELSLLVVPRLLG